MHTPASDAHPHLHGRVRRTQNFDPYQLPHRRGRPLDQRLVETRSRVRLGCTPRRGRRGCLSGPPGRDGRIGIRASVRGAPGVALGSSTGHPAGRPLCVRRWRPWVHPFLLSERYLVGSECYTGRYHCCKLQHQPPWICWNCRQTATSVASYKVSGISDHGWGAAVDCSTGRNRWTVEGSPGFNSAVAGGRNAPARPFVRLPVGTSGQCRGRRTGRAGRKPISRRAPASRTRSA